MKHDIPDGQSDDRIHRHVKLCGQPKEPTNHEIKLFIALVESIVKRSRMKLDEEKTKA